jgi:murein L,D-transpeptidase YcbB/YkuD
MMQITVCWRICMLSIVVFAGLCARGMAMPQLMARQPLSASMPEQLRSRIGAVGLVRGTTVRSEMLGALDALVHFYGYRGFQPLWVGDEGLLPQASALLHAVCQAEHGGIRPTVYHLHGVGQLMAELGRRDPHERSRNLHSWVDLELLLTDAFFLYSAHVLTGQIDPRDLKEVWFGERSQIDLGAALQQASKTDRVAEFLQTLRPTHAGYAALRKALKEGASRSCTCRRAFRCTCCIGPPGWTKPESSIFAKISTSGIRCWIRLSTRSFVPQDVATRSKWP